VIEFWVLQRMMARFLKMRLRGLTGDGDVPMACERLRMRLRG
jgi:hypothetical protein